MFRPSFSGPDQGGLAYPEHELNTHEGSFCRIQGHVFYFEAHFDLYCFGLHCPSLDFRAVCDLRDGQQTWQALQNAATLAFLEPEVGGLALDLCAAHYGRWLDFQFCVADSAEGKQRYLAQHREALPELPEGVEMPTRYLYAPNPERPEEFEAMAQALFTQANRIRHDRYASGLTASGFLARQLPSEAKAQYAGSVYLQLRPLLGEVWRLRQEIYTRLLRVYHTERLRVQRLQRFKEFAEWEQYSGLLRVTGAVGEFSAAEFYEVLEQAWRSTYGCTVRYSDDFRLVSMSTLSKWRKKAERAYWDAVEKESLNKRSFGIQSI